MSNGSYLTYEYDALYRLSAIVNQLGERIDYTLDAMGNRIGVVTKSASLNVVRAQQQVFDELGRLRNALGENGQSELIDYDLNNNPTSTADAYGNGLARAFDALDRAVGSTDAISGVGTYRYDARDNLIEVVDPRGVTTEYVYDGFDNLLLTISPDSGETIYYYDAAGNLTSQVDANTVVTNYSYDALNRLATLAYPSSPSEAMTYGYDATPNATGLLSTINDQSGSTSYRYDDVGRQVETLSTIGGITYTSQVEYAVNGDMNSVTYPSGRSIRYVRDSLGRVENLISEINGVESTLVSGIDYLPFGPAQAYQQGNGTQTALVFDEDYRLSTVSVQNAVGAVLDLGYSFDFANNITSIDQASTIPEAFAYDDLYRLTDATGSYGVVEYSYDAVGNRLSDTESSSLKNYTYEPAANRLSTIEALAVSLDAAGNTLQQDGKSYTYNAQNRMAASLVGAVNTSYRYNALGQRVLKQNNEATTHYIFGTGGELIAEHSDTGAVLQEYIYLDGRPVVTFVPAAEDEAIITLDSEDLSTQLVGQWQISTAISGYNGANYLFHKANGVPAGGLVVDNSDSGFSTTGVWSASTAIAGYQGGNYQHHFANGASPDGIELDNLDGVTTGQWNTSTSVGGYTNTNYSFAAAGAGESEMTWQIPVSAAGSYQVYARWTAHSNRASNAKYTVHVSGQASIIEVNQKTNGGQYQLLGEYSLSPGDSVSLSNDADGYVIADGLLIVPPNAAPNTATWVLTADADDEYRLSANW